MIHLQGMGLLGSLTAWKLRQHGVGFTWSDNDSPVNAWRACTGACYPSGGELDARCHAAWLEWYKDYPPDRFEVCGYWTDRRTKSQPHGLEVAEINGTDHLRLLGESVHVDAQGLVRDTRDEFADARRDAPPPGSQLIVSHGFTHRLDRYLWGWTRLVRLDVSALPRPDGGRPSLYLRRNRFQFAYCYPKPGTGWWYAGSSLVSQRTPAALDPRKRYESWKVWFEELTGGSVRVVQEGGIIGGWRPKAVGGTSSEEGFKKTDRRMLEVRKGVIYFPTLATGGFRHFPAVWDELAETVL